jgi:hypothetical protein
MKSLMGGDGSVPGGYPPPRGYDGLCRSALPRSLAGALAAIRYAREHDRPFIGTWGVSNILVRGAPPRMTDAAHAEYGGDPRPPSSRGRLRRSRCLGARLKGKQRAETRPIVRRHGHSGYRDRSEFTARRADRRFQPLFDTVVSGVTGIGDERVRVAERQRAGSSSQLFLPGRRRGGRARSSTRTSRLPQRRLKAARRLPATEVT